MRATRYLMPTLRELQVETDQVRIVVAQLVLAAKVGTHGFEVAHGAASFAFGTITLPRLRRHVALAGPIVDGVWFRASSFPPGLPHR